MDNKEEKRIKNAREWMSPARGKEAEQSIDLLSTSSRNRRDCSRFLITLLLLKMK